MLTCALIVWILQPVNWNEEIIRDTFLTKNGWAINMKSGIINSETDSAIQDGIEKESLKNLNRWHEKINSRPSSKL